MRRKTDEKRRAILAAAGTLFLEQGYDVVSMTEIAKALGGSKATLYGYFTSKTEIFLAVMLEKARELGEKAQEVLASDLPLQEKLRAYGVEHLTFMLSDEMIDMKRVVIAQAHKDGIGKQVYECGMKRAWGRVCQIIEDGIAAGTLLLDTDPWRAAMQYKALLEADIHMRRMLKVDDKPTRRQIVAAVDNALLVFWGHYALKA